MIASRHYGARGVLETLYTFFQPVAHLLTLALCLVLGVTLGADLADGAGVGALGGLIALWPLAAGLTVVSVAPCLLWGPSTAATGAPDRSFAVSLLWGLALWLYAYHLFPASARAVGRMVRGRGGWAKTRRNAEVVTAGPVAIES